MNSYYLEIVKQDYETHLDNLFPDLDDDTRDLMLKYRTEKELKENILYPLYDKHHVTPWWLQYKRETYPAYAPSTIDDSRLYYNTPNEYNFFDPEDDEYLVEELKSSNRVSRFKKCFELLYYKIFLTKSEDCILDFILEMRKEIDHLIEVYHLNSSYDELAEEVEKAKEKTPILKVMLEDRISGDVINDRDHFSILPKIKDSHLGNVAKAYYDSIMAFIDDYSKYSPIFILDLLNYYDKLNSYLRQQTTVLLEKDIKQLETWFEIILRVKLDDIKDLVKQNKPFDVEFDNKTLNFTPNIGNSFRSDYSFELIDGKEIYKLSRVFIHITNTYIGVHVGKSKDDEIQQLNAKNNAAN